jgi:hypothetical protein
LDDQSRSRVCPKKKRRAQLIQRANPQPTWALGFGDEVWWSRLAQPNQHCWTDPKATPKLQELTPPTEDADPKALACDGLLVRPWPQQADQMWLRFVAGRPVSAVTIAFLAWCSTQAFPLSQQVVYNQLLKISDFVNISPRLSMA